MKYIFKNAFSMLVFNILEQILMKTSTPGIVVFMIQGLKESVPIVAKASPEVTLTGQWLADEVSDCITSLG